MKNNKLLIVFFLFSLFFSLTNFQEAKAETKLAPGSVVYSKDYPIINYDQSVQLFDDVGKYRLHAIGGSNIVAADRGKVAGFKTGDYVNPGKAKISSSAMDFKTVAKTPKIKKAYFYIQQFHGGFIYNVTNNTSRPDYNRPNRNGSYLEGPKGGQFKINTGTANHLYDVTDFVQAEGAGRYWGKDIPHDRAGTGDSIAGWTLVIIEEDDALPYYRKTMLDMHGGVRLRTNSSQTLNIGDSKVPFKESDPTGEIILTSTGGNDSKISANYAGDYAKIVTYKNNKELKTSTLSSPLRLENDFFNSSLDRNGVNIKERLPFYDLYNGIDISIMDINHPVNKAYFAGSPDRLGLIVGVGSGENFGIEMMGASVDVDSPTIIKFEGHANNHQNIETPAELENKANQLNIFISKSSNLARLYDGNYEIIFPQHLTLDEQKQIELIDVASGKKTNPNYTYDKNKGLLKIPFALFGEKESNLKVPFLRNDQFRRGDFQVKAKGLFQTVTGEKSNVSLEYKTKDIPLQKTKIKLTEKMVNKKGGLISSQTITEKAIDTTLTKKDSDFPDGIKLIGYYLDGSTTLVPASQISLKLTKDYQVTYVFDMAVPLNMSGEVTQLQSLTEAKLLNQLEWQSKKRVVSNTDYSVDRQDLENLKKVQTQYEQNKDKYPQLNTILKPYPLKVYLKDKATGKTNPDLFQTIWYFVLDTPTNNSLHTIELANGQTKQMVFYQNNKFKIPAHLVNSYASSPAKIMELSKTRGYGRYYDFQQLVTSATAEAVFKQAGDPTALPLENINAFKAQATTKVKKDFTLRLKDVETAPSSQKRVDWEAVIVPHFRDIEVSFVDSEGSPVELYDERQADFKKVAPLTIKQQLINSRVNLLTETTIKNQIQTIEEDLYSLSSSNQALETYLVSPSGYNENETNPAKNKLKVKLVFDGQQGIHSVTEKLTFEPGKYLASKNQFLSNRSKEKFEIDVIDNRPLKNSKNETVRGGFLVNARLEKAFVSKDKELDAVLSLVLENNKKVDFSQKNATIVKNFQDENNKERRFFNFILDNDSLISQKGFQLKILPGVTEPSYETKIIWELAKSP